MNELKRKQTLLKGPGPLLDKRGVLTQSGYATEPVLQYDRNAIKAPPWRIKEWDFYQVSDNETCVQLTIGHTSYAGAVTVTFFRFADGYRVDRNITLALPFGSLNMPSSADKGLSAVKNGVGISFIVEKGRRILRCKTIADKDIPPIEAEIILQQSHTDSLVIATPFKEYDHAFYYNHKINCMPASGYIKIGNERTEYKPDTAFGLLDWGRGCWPFHAEWFWGSGSGMVDGKVFGFNIGYGFGDTTAASENMLFYDGKAHKISEVYFDLAKGGYMSPKHFSSDDGRFEMDFEPVYDRYTETKVLFVDNHCHQVFGKFTGKAILDDGTVLQVKDLMAFTEHAVNNW